jgi:hypothetical protein
MEPKGLHAKNDLFGIYIQGVSGGILNILGGGIMDYSE